MKYDKVEISLVECKESDVISTSGEITTPPIWPWGKPPSPDMTDMGVPVDGSYNTK